MNRLLGALHIVQYFVRDEEDDDSLLHFYKDIYRALPSRTSPRVHATLLSFGNVSPGCTLDESRTITVTSLEELNHLLLETIIQTYPGLECPWRILVIADPGKEVVEAVGGCLQVPFAFFASHLQDGVLLKDNADLPRQRLKWVRSPESPRCLE